MSARTAGDARTRADPAGSRRLQDARHRQGRASLHPAVRDRQGVAHRHVGQRDQARAARASKARIRACQKNRVPQKRGAGVQRLAATLLGDEKADSDVAVALAPRLHCRSVE